VASQCGDLADLLVRQLLEHPEVLSSVAYLALPYEGLVRLAPTAAARWWPGPPLWGTPTALPRAWRRGTRSTRYCANARCASATLAGRRTRLCGAPEITAQVKAMRFGSGLGANRSDTQGYREAEPGRAQALRTALARRGAGPQAQRGLQGLQRRHGPKGTASCAVISGATHSLSRCRHSNCWSAPSKVRAAQAAANTARSRQCCRTSECRGR